MKLQISLVCVFSFLILTACSGNGASTLEQIQGRDIITGPPGRVPPELDPSHSDPAHLRLGLKYVVYQDALGHPVVTAAEAKTVIQEINEIWKQCNLSFVLDEYDSVNPSDHSLDFQTANFRNLDTIRNSFNDGHSFLAVTTGPWNRSGTLGSTGANAWTAMPGGGPYGAIFEQPVGTISNLIAHELGHYLNLDHVDDSNDVMNPIIYGRSLALSESQCSNARSAALYFWGPMLR